MADTVQISVIAKDAASQVFDKVGGSLDKMGKQAETTSSKLSAMGDKAAGIGDKLSVGVTLPLVAVGTAAVKMASDLSETQSKVGVLFGDMSADMLAWSKTAATSFGISKKAALDGASTFAIFGKSAGLAGDDLNEFSKENVQLASDMASFFNTSPEDAIQAIGAAFRGEAEPIRRYGVLINDASLKDEALRQGLIKTTKDALTPQQRVLAVQSLILKQTSAAQGDFARTADGMANSTRIMKAQLENAAAELGEKLLPIVNKGINIINGLLEAFQGLSPEVQDAVVALAGVAAAAGPVLSVGGRLISTVQLLGKGIGALGIGAAPVVAILAGLAAIAVYLGKVGEAAQATTDDLIEMSHSGDLFKQAAATTEILVNGQDRLRKALDATHEEIKTGKANYADYLSSIEATAQAAGFRITAEGDLVQVLRGIGGETIKLIESNYALSESEYALENTGRTRGEIARDLVGKLSELASAAQEYNRQNQTAIEQSGSVAEGLGAQAGATQQSNAAIREYSNSLLYAVQQSQAKKAADEESAKADAAYRESIGETTVKVSNLAQSLVKATDAQAKQILAQTQLDALKKAFEAGTISEEEFNKATDQVLLRYDLATPKSLAMADAQKAVTDAFLAGKVPLEDFIASSEKIPSIADDGTVSQKELAQLGIMPTTVAVREQAIKVAELEQSWLKIPKQVKTTYTIEVKGEVPSGGSPGKSVPQKQKGGPVSEGLYYLHNDEYVLSRAMRLGREPIPREAIPAQQVMQRGGDVYTYYTTINDRAAARMWEDQQRRERIDRSNARMGV